ncbi:hypothetical protein LEP1GSC037_5452 [Leptospira interrogans str. 2006001854]|uniref:Uncharacterized protein n=1 Tax=Leptospira interrogans str. 2006001854 TaxID=1001590 RepID=M6GAN0_LEPIR|nr:hypothetical protein LEP1GSC037_5452 [Leptospira interrogans str. 2006001854]
MDLKFKEGFFEKNATKSLYRLTAQLKNSDVSMLNCNRQNKI